MKTLYYWILVSDDEFELPMFIEPTRKKLSKMIGISEDRLKNANGKRIVTPSICGKVYKIVA